MSEEMERRLREDRAAIDRRLRESLDGLDCAAPRLAAAMEYSLLGGGKRLRALLCLWGSDALGAERSDALWLAAQALEFLHCYSLIHDDLPAMDDDDLRRGQPSCHRRFDEATAILAGDALHSAVFELLARIEDPALARELVFRLSRAAGVSGMAGGQQLDLQGADERGDAALGERIHRLKTGALLGAALAMGARCAGASAAVVDDFGRLGEDAGLAFQVIDDVLDQTRSAEQLGKSPGKDLAQGKLSSVRTLGGVEAARDHAEGVIADCLDRLGRLAGRRTPLAELLRLLVSRQS